MTTKRAKRVVKALSFMFRGVSNEWRRKGRKRLRLKEKNIKSWIGPNNFNTVASSH